VDVTGIEADISKDLIVPVFKETVQEPSIKTDISVNKDDGKTKTVKAAQQATGALSIIDTTNVLWFYTLDLTNFWFNWYCYRLRLNICRVDYR
jgi:hypothetical protein